MRLLIAGGGTGGHLFPALAIARKCVQEISGAQVHFVGTAHGIESRILPQSEFKYTFISARGLKKTGIKNTLMGFTELPLALVQSIKIIMRFKPDFVLGVGGYASGPTLAAAIMMRIPSAVHEQNSVMGTTNRILSKYVKRVFISWENTEPLPPHEKVLLTGNPVRGDIAESASKVIGTHDPTERHLFIFGGSKGAQAINEALIKDASVLAQIKGLKIVHQVGLGNKGPVLDAYKVHGINAEVLEFIDDMASAYSWADLVICRSGAGSLAELATIGKPAVLIPYPYAIGDHQAKNAAIFASAGAAEVIRNSDLGSGALGKTTLSLFNDPQRLTKMSRNCKALDYGDSALTIVQDIMKLVRKNK